jgi:type IV pilus biogenesis protein CpaD/CtpE
MTARPLRLALAVALAWATVGCTGDDDPSTQPEPKASDSSPAAPTLSGQDASLEVSIEQLSGAIRREQRPVLKRLISKPIAAWVSAGYSAGAASGDSYPKAFAGWTRDAARLARRDDDVTTNAVMGKDLSSVVIASSRARLYVFSAKGRTGGATARVSVRMTGERQDGSSTSYAVTGSLYLTREQGRWRIFGYDLTQREIR